MKSVFKSIDRVLLKKHSVKNGGNQVTVKKVMTVLVLWPKLGRFHAKKNSIYTRGVKKLTIFF